MNRKGEDELVALDRDTAHATLAMANWSTGKFTLFGDIEAHIADAASNFLLATEDNGTVTFYINSAGGDCDYSLGLVALMEQRKREGVKIATIGMGMVASSALDIFSAGSPGCRVLHSFCLVMLHAQAGSYSTNREGQLRRKIDEALIKRYSTLSQKQRSTVLNAGDHYLNPYTAVEWGLADSVYEYKSQESRAEGNGDGKESSDSKEQDKIEEGDSSNE